MRIPLIGPSPPHLENSKLCPDLDRGANNSEKNLCQIFKEILKFWEKSQKSFKKVSKISKILENLENLENEGFRHVLISSHSLSTNLHRKKSQNFLQPYGEFYWKLLKIVEYEIFKDLETRI